MENAKSLNVNFERAAWGVSLIWLGLTWMVSSIPEGAGLVGIGVILLGLNALRAMNNIRISGWTVTLGILSLVWGGLELLQPVLHLPFKLPIFEILMIILGIILLGSTLIQYKQE